MKSNIEQIALEFARKWHKGQYRKDNITPYINHPVDVVSLLKEWGVNDNASIAAAYLHDLLEDTNVKEATIRQVFGPNILNKVKKLTKEENQNKEEYIKNIAKDSDIYVLLIKYADRISNTLDFILDGNFDWGEKYFHKADVIYNRLKSESKVLGKILPKVIKDHNEVLKIFKTYNS